jgi:REP element-mobilizing transposase RayT
MVRPLRIQFPGALYHVTARGNERKDVFLDDKDRWTFIRLLHELNAEYSVTFHAWVLMDNHYHLLLETQEANLSSALRHLNGVYTQRFNKRYERVGHLFQGRYKAFLVDKDHYYKEVCRYVVLNPVRANMVKDPRDWKWSSYRTTAGFDSAEKGFETGWLLKQFGGRPTTARKMYRKFVLEGVGRKENPFEEVAGDLLLGTTGFKETIRERLKGRQAVELTDQQTRLTRLEPEEILARTAGWYGVGIERVKTIDKKPNEARDMAAWCMRCICRSRLQEIAEVLGVRYSTVSHALSRVRAREKTDREYVQKVLAALSKT